MMIFKISFKTMQADLKKFLIYEHMFEFLHAFRYIWTSTAFADCDLTRYAGVHINFETKRGVSLLSLIALLFLSMSFALSSFFELGNSYTYTYAILTGLSFHIYLSASHISQIKALNLLAMLLLIVCGSSLVLLTQQTGQLSMMVLLSVVLLFMLVPVVPWGLREAVITIGAIYVMFTASTFLNRLRFSLFDLWLLQFLMVVAAIISLALVTRALVVRKHDLSMRFNLEQAHGEMTELVNRDHLTGAWNRRYIESDFTRAVASHHNSELESYFGLFDIDRFKEINDNFGHLRGDDVLKAVYRAFADFSGENEYLVRLGGDEFALLMCGEDVLKHISKALEEISGAFTDVGMRGPTVSLGLIKLTPEDSFSFDQAYKKADELLYEAKRAGGNRIRLHANTVNAGDMSDGDLREYNG